MASSIPGFDSDRLLLVGFIKDRVSATKHENLEELKEVISTESRRLPLELCQRACRSVSKRLQLSKDLEGRHFEHLL